MEVIKAALTGIKRSLETKERMRIASIKREQENIHYKAYGSLKNGHFYI